jgi:hypothetical protein
MTARTLVGPLLTLGLLTGLTGCIGPVEQLIDSRWASNLPDDPLGGAIPHTKFIPLAVPTFRFAGQDFPGFTTGNGKRADPVNLLIVGDPVDLPKRVIQAFAQAQWIVPDPITVGNLQKQALALSHRVTYPSAPVSDLFLFSKVQELAYEKNSDDINKRDHIRLWVSPFLDGDRIVFCAAGTKDKDVKIDPGTRLPTHQIDPDVDAERTYVVNDLLATHLLVASTSVPNDVSVKSGTNAGGDHYFSDGNIAVLEQAP